MKKRGQITYFILVGFVVLIGAFLLINIKDISKKQLEEQLELELEEPIETISLQTYIKSCIDDASPEPIETTIKQGGAFNLADDFVWYYNQKYHYLCHNEHNKGCVNNLLLRQEIEEELAAEIKLRLKECIDLNIFKEKGYEIEEGELNVIVRIFPDDTRIILNYPITLEKFDDKIEEEVFASNIPIPFGKLYKLAVDIVNNELTNGYFDQDKWMEENGVYIFIERHRPYPDIVYNLTRIDPIRKKEYSFLFALQGGNTVSLLPEFQNIESDYGCCYNAYDALCFKNTPEELCRSKYGAFDPGDSYPGDSCECVGMDTNYGSPQCEDGACNDCPKTYEFKTNKFEGEEKKHGESWCSYDSILNSRLGHGGMSYVGSRHYKHTCIDGKEYVEECRDFREELCTETETNGVSKAVCRPNRWQDCWSCNTKSCCENSELRDCKWSEFLFSEMDDIEYSNINKCYPIIPPGFKFWEGNGIDVCNIATHYAECEGVSCPNNWVDQSALYCYFQGDCGNYRNIADRLTEEGFFNSDPTDYVRDYVYHRPGLNKNPVEILRKPLNLDLDKRDTTNSLVNYPPVAETIPYLLSAGLNYIDYVSSLSVSDFINPFKDPEIKVLDYALCSVWSAPIGNSDCSLCSEKFRPCTEYRCKSLGQLCRFETENGVGSCIPYNINDNVKPIVEFDEDVLTQGYKATKTRINVIDKHIDGHEIKPAIKAYSKFTFGIKTNEPAKCKLAYLPNISYRYMPSVWFGQSSFTEKRNISIRFPKGIALPQNVYDALDIKSLTELVDRIDNLEATYEEFKDKYEDELELYEQFTGIDVISRIDPQVKIGIRIVNRYRKLFPYIKAIANIILSDFERSTYYLFVKCIDQAGNENNDFFIKFAIDQTIDEEPVILEVIPKNNSIIEKTKDKFDLKLYVNKPSECRYSSIDTDYDNMRKMLECPRSMHETSPVEYGSYECKGEIPFTIDNLKLYFRCKDNPLTEESYTLNLLYSTDFSLNKGISSRYFSLIQPNKLVVDADLLSQDYEVNFSTESIELSLYISDLRDCRYSYENKNFEDMQRFSSCQISQNLDIGYYYCDATVPLTNKDTTINIKCRDTTTGERNKNKKSYVYNVYKES